MSSVSYGTDAAQPSNHQLVDDPLDPIAFVLGDALVGGETRVLATSARSPSVATLLARAATLTTRFGGKVGLIVTVKLSNALSKRRDVCVAVPARETAMGRRSWCRKRGQGLHL